MSLQNSIPLLVTSLTGFNPTSYAEAFTTLHHTAAIVNAQHEQAYTSVLSQFIDDHMDIVTLLAGRKSKQPPLGNQESAQGH